MFSELFSVKERSETYFKRPRHYILPLFDGWDIFLVLGGSYKFIKNDLPHYVCMYVDASYQEETPTISQKYWLKWKHRYLIKFI